MPPQKQLHRFRARQIRPALRARMRDGNLSALDGTRLADCTLFDTMDGDTGVLVEPDIALPHQLLLHDALDQTVATVRVLWREGRQLALTMETPPVSASIFHADGLRD